MSLKTLAHQVAELDVDAMEDADELRRALKIIKEKAQETLEDCFGGDPKRRTQILDLAREHESEGDLELDDDENVVISEGDDNGTYVMMWKWVDFAGTELDKEVD